MGHAAFATIFSQSSDANYRSWVGQCLSGMIAAGWAQTADTGQVTPATVGAITKPTAIGISGAGTVRALFGLDDTLQSAYPIYLMVVWGTGSTSADAPAMWISVGQGTDGAGNLTGVFGTFQCAGGYNSANGRTTTLPAVAGIGEGWMAFLAGQGVVTSTFHYDAQFVVERSRGADGTPTGSGLAVIYERPATGTGGPAIVDLALVDAFNYVSGASVHGCVPVVVPGVVQGTNMGNGTSLAAGGIGPVFPIVYLAPAVAPWQSGCVVSIPVGDLPAGVFTVNLLGQAVQMYPCVLNQSCAWGLAYSGTTTPAYSNYVTVGMRWDE